MKDFQQSEDFIEFKRFCGPPLVSADLWSVSSLEESSGTFA